ncbi:cbb3-type cytochrome c oxidase subunit 3 [Pontixanthobacter aestiaquae]|uniref:CcoQ/FixQ family Cbb3-type cytochrome c oxidase assembly chaperone n=1 Tax=Pontixanthobacter aestiaquae TaxID=1509367 RepID=A0A844Z4S5_9SPHN|nr:cbb3-type cytochrome c oxidase subunit 3 [Pontixanthobacter aestiaquae]MDN3647251.1 cbb3-type cytochrome c oxidase subunit 3 [Pontixanthobacter aestiaquae]MXO81773.1 CcoQ/FixQ family Cbb3-type cytochrome c oxidase assembly chaperone [Pontixanthobacter aestiaquae]
MTQHSTYEFLRQLADSWGLLAMLLSFLVLILWPFRPGAKQRNHEAATAIFEDHDHGE